MKALYSVKKLFYKISAGLNVVGVSLMVIITFTILVDVVGRLFFRAPVPGTYELVEYAMLIVIAFAMPYCQVRRGHIEVTSFVNILPKKVQAVFNFFDLLVATFMLFIVSWQTIVKIGIDFRSGVTSAVLFIPRWPFVLLASIGFTLMTIIFFLQMITPNDPDDQPGEQEEANVI